MNKKHFPKRKHFVRQSYNGIRHTHSTIAGVEDLIAVLIDLLYSVKRQATIVDALNRETTEAIERVEKAIHILHVLRRGPYAYPTDDDIIAIKTIKGDGRHATIHRKEKK